MNKEEILEKARKEKDERETMIEQMSFVYGAIGMAMTFITLSAIRFMSKGERLYDLLAMFESFLAAHYFYKYTKFKDKMNLLFTLIWTFGAIINLILYAF